MKVLTSKFMSFMARRQERISGVNYPKEFPTNPEKFQLAAANFIVYVVDELFEALKEIPGHKPWKRSESKPMGDSARKKLLLELVDVFIQFVNLLIMLNFTAEEFNSALEEKLRYNDKRPDHDVNNS